MVRRRKKSNYKVKYRHGYLSEISNVRGKKPGVYIFQGMKPGFSASYIKGHKMVKIKSSRSAEALARKLARRGHRKIIFRD